MKHICWIVVALLGCFGCKKHDGGQTDNNSKLIALLKVDYQTHAFEGGKLFSFNVNDPNPQQVPVQMTYVPPGDFGNITLKYALTNDTVFDGSIVWNGKGHMTYPVLNTDFATGPITVPAPDTNDVQVISPNTFIKKEEYDIPAVWSGINNIYFVRDFMQRSNTRVALFLYTPSVGVGNPADWDYFWLLYTDNPPPLF